jgi:beta-glucosidase
MEHTASSKDFVNIFGNSTLSEKQKINVYLGYSDSYDQRNGELTREQYEDFDYSGNPNYIKNNAHSHVVSFRGGLNHDYQFNRNIGNSFSVFGTVKFQLAGDDGYRLFVNDKLITGDWGNHSFSTRSAFMQVSAGEIYRLRIEYFDNVGEATVSFQAGMMDEERLASSLKHARNVIVCAGFNSSTEGEGFDRPFALSYGQEYLINKVASLHDNVAVVVNAGGGIDFRNWGQSVQAILMAWYPGQEGGKALAEIITGKLSPSGKLPVSIEEKWEDNPVYGNYYDNRNVPHKRVQYAEGVFVGYRGYDRNGKQPLYPFGYGLSYSSFEYSNLSVEKTGGSRVTVSFDIKNTGKMDAAEAAQVYVRDVECSVPRPLKELKGYDKVYLKKGETKRVRILLDEEAFAYYDVESHRFVVEKGTFEILAGPSSADLPLKATVVL